MHSFFLWMQHIVKLQFPKKCTINLRFNLVRDMTEIVPHIGRGGCIWVRNGRRVILLWNPQVVHGSVDVIVNGLEVENEVVVHSTGKAELHKRTKVLIV